MMILPDFYFVDHQGEKLPSKDGKQHIRQYSGYWRVRVDSAWEGRVAIEGNPLLFLDQINVGEWELGTGKDRLKGSVGTLCARLIDSRGNIVGNKQFLQIAPANASWSDLQIMLEDIGVLSVLSTSCTEIEVPTPLQENTGVTGPGVALNRGYGAIRTASSLIELYEVLKSNWSSLQQHPIKSINLRAV
ncbi:MAG: hypothetical protein EOO88_45725 [Pedobacter sp.]|nr:MAG: hypothetical protein EOO88_45725 [Pedobacter sp.]